MAGNDDGEEDRSQIMKVLMYSSKDYSETWRDLRFGSYMDDTALFVFILFLKTNIQANGGQIAIGRESRKTS